MQSHDAPGCRVNEPEHPSATYSALAGLRNMAAYLIFLALATPAHPVAQRNGRIDEVGPNGVVLSVEGGLPQLEPNIRFSVQVFAPTGVVHFFSRPVAPVEDGAKSLTLALPDKLESIQRRRFARAPFSGEIHYQPIHNGKPRPGDKGVGIDLSAGGLKMSTSSPLQPGQELLLHFQTPDGRPYRGIAAQVVRLEHQGGRYVLACRFESLTEHQEAALVQAVFRMQIRSAASQR